jgi:ATP-dependent DNA helicase RecG
VGHRFIRALIDRYLDQLLPFFTELLPDQVRESLGLPGIQDALRSVHRPTSVVEAELGRRRLAFDELFDLQLHARACARGGQAGAQRGWRWSRTVHSPIRLRAHLPWTLTEDQDKALAQILGDMASPERMHRLLMGDVGTGKTVVALLAMLVALENEHQAALMAPTELLAEQHASTMAKLLAPIGLMPEVLLGRQTASEKARGAQAARGRRVTDS